MYSLSSPLKPKILNRVWTPDRQVVPNTAHFIRTPKHHPYVSRAVGCNAEITTQPMRRSGNYRPPAWDFDYIQSLDCDYLDKSYVKQRDELKIQVNKMLEERMEELDQLKLIDNLQKLGLSYHFEDKIRRILADIYQQRISSNDLPIKGKDLYATALKFRLLREHGFNVSQVTFQQFYDENYNLKPNVMNDMKGLLQLYEASNLLVEGETSLELVRGVTERILREKLENRSIDENADELLVQRALKIPLHWRAPRPEARWFIDVYYEKSARINPLLLQLAKLDFNIVQASHQEELKELSRWWRRTELAEKLPFARDRLVECFVWEIVARWTAKPKPGFLQTVTKANIMITIIDDMYDVYGTLEELELFTSAVERWDVVEAMEMLPTYMRTCYLALYNFSNEVAYDVLRGHALNVVPHLRKVWTDLCKIYLQEAKWYHSRYIPSFEEYIQNARISSAGPLILLHTYLAGTNQIEEQALQCFENYGDIIRSSSTILRLVNDLETSSFELQRGDVLKSVQCYLNETGINEEQAREHIKVIIGESWKKLNRDHMAEDSPFPMTFRGLAVDTIARIAHYMYQDGDGFGIQNDDNIGDRISRLLFEPILLP